VPGGEHNDKRILQQRKADKSIGTRGPQEGDIDASAANQIEQFAAEALLKREVYIRKCLPKFVNDPGHERNERSRRGNADTNAPPLAPGSALRNLDRILQTGQHVTGLAMEGNTRFRQLDSARPAYEQLDVEIAFDVLDQAAERWLLNAELVRGARDMTFLRNCYEIAKLAQIHDMPLLVWLLTFSYHSETAARAIGFTAKP
jgi:hypothetical protein